jgi:DHA2 family multidrug resistance protein-like MFS transporter
MVTVMTTLGARRWWALGALALTLLVVGLDLTVLNVALPTLAVDLHASTGQLQWFANAYNLVLAAALLPAGLLGDRFGRKRLLLIALGLFALASVACAYAGSAGALIGARAVLGLGASFLLPLSVAVLPVLFSAEERPRAIAVWASANAIGIPLGPVLGGWLLDNYWWGSVFLINLPVIVLAIVAVAVLLPESRSSYPPRLDLVGVLTSSLGLVGLTYGVIEAGERGWSDPVALVSMVAGVLVLAGFVAWQRRQSRRPGGQPLVDLSLFRSASFTWGAILATLVSFALFGVLFMMPQYFQAVGGADAFGTGLRLLPVIGGLLVGAQVAGRVAPRIGAKVTVAIGLGLLAAGLAAGATTAVDSGYGFAAAWFSVVGLGFGFAMPTAMDAAIGAIPTERSGVGSALVMAMRFVGGTIGVALLGTVLNADYHSRLDLTGLPAAAVEAVRRSVSGGVAAAQQLGSEPLLVSVRSAFVHAMDTTLWVCAGVVALGIALTLVFLPSRATTVEPGPAEPAPSRGDAVVAG